MDSSLKISVSIFLLVVGSISSWHVEAATYDVSSTQELRVALQSVGDIGGENTIRLAAGRYSTQDDGEGTFELVAWSAGTSLVLEGVSRDLVVLDGASEHQILLFNLVEKIDEIVIREIHFENGYVESLRGGAIGIKRNNPKVLIEKSKFTGNSAYSGGAVDIYYLTVSNTEFLSNSAVRSGGAINSNGVVDISNCLFQENQTTTAITVFDYSGGGAVRARGIYSGANFIRDSVFVRNRSASDGGAIHWSTRLPGSVSGNTFTENESDTNGGAIAASEGYGSEQIYNQLITNNTFLGNKSGKGGAAIHNRSAGANLRVVQNIFVNNVSAADMVGIYADQSGYGDDYPLLIASNLLKNTPIQPANQSNYILNNIFLDNETDIVSSNGEVIIHVENNYIDLIDLPNALIRKSGNIFEGVELEFVEANENDFRLVSGSGLIDAGTSDPTIEYFPEYDFTNNTGRTLGSSIDIGPYEFVPDGLLPLISSFSFTGELRVGSVVTFTFDIEESDVEAGITTYFDFGDGEEQIAEGAEYVFDTPGSYTVRLIVVNEEGARSSRSLSFDIRDLTLEEKLDAAEQTGRDSVINNRALYGLLTSSDLEAQLGELQGELSAELESAVQAAYEAVKNDPTAFGIDIGFDIDGDGESKALTDGLLLIRYLFGFSGDSLVSGAIGSDATRDTAEAVEAYIEERVPSD